MTQFCCRSLEKKKNEEGKSLHPQFEIARNTMVIIYNQFLLWFVLCVIYLQCTTSGESEMDYVVTCNKISWELLTVVTTDGTCVSRLRSLLVWRWGCRHIAGICYYGFTITSNKLFLHMHLLYNCRLGIYYSPLLTVVVVIKLWLIFYLKRVSVSSTSAVSVRVVRAHSESWPQPSYSLIAS